MVAAIIPAAIVGIILLVLGGRLISSTSGLFPDREEQARRNEKGAVGNTVDFLVGEGQAARLRESVAQKGVAGTAVDLAAGQGAAAGAARFLDDQYTSFQIATHNALTDPLNLRGIPDLTLSQVKALQRAGLDVTQYTAQELHDIVLGAGGAETPAQQPSGGVEPNVEPSPLAVAVATGGRGAVFTGYGLAARARGARGLN